MKHETFMKIAETIANESKCISKQVGAIIVKDDRVISHGYNGSPQGQPNCCDVAVEEKFGCLKNPYMYDSAEGDRTRIAIVDRAKHSAWSERNEIHAEQNAIIFAARQGLCIDGGIMYTTHSPCPTCCKLIAQSGISQVFYREQYDRSPEGWDDILINGGITLNHLKKEMVENV